MNPLQKLNEKKAAKKRRWQALGVFTVALSLVLCAVPLLVRSQPKPVEVFIDTAADAEQTEVVAGKTTFDEIFESVVQVSKAVASEAPLIQKPAPSRATFNPNAKSFQEGLDGILGSTGSVQRLSYASSSQEPVAAPKPAVWNPPLDQRQAIARNYLLKHCKALISLENMQSAESKKETDTRFMAAKNPGDVISSLLGELRAHNIVVGQFCPTEFYNKLFAQKR